MPPLGTRVRRGRDWKWKFQDSFGLGTVIGHSKDGKYDSLSTRPRSVS